MQIFVKSLSNEFFDLIVEASGSIATIKARIHSLGGSSPDQVFNFLLFNSEDGQSLADPLPPPLQFGIPRNKSYGSRA